MRSKHNENVDQRGRVGEGGSKGRVVSDLAFQW